MPSDVSSLAGKWRCRLHRYLLRKYRGGLTTSERDDVMQDAFVRFLCKQQDEPALVLHYCDLLEFLKTSTRKHFRSKRRQANLSERPDQADTRKYSTAAQMRDVVKYAAERAAETPSQMPQFEETVMLVLARDVVGFTSEELGSITGKSFGYANTRISRLHNTLKNNQALR